MQPTSLVTGGAGFMGSHVVDELLKRGQRVVVVDDLSGGFVDNVSPGAVFRKGSILDHVWIADLFAEYRFDYVFHLAAYAAEGLSHFIRRFNYNNNVVGSINLINEAVRYNVKAFVFTSSIAVYGSAKPPMLESVVPQPEDPYGIAKYTVELDLACARSMFGLNHVIFRPHNVYGERQNLGDRYRNVVGIFMNEVMQGRPCRVFGDGTQTRAFTHIADVAPVIAASAENPAAYGQIFNIGADQPYSVNELASEVQAAMGRQVPIEHVEARHEVLHAFSSHDKAKEMLGYHPSIGLKEGLARMAEWAWNAGARSPSLFGGIEIDKNFPPSWRAACSQGEPSQ